MPKLEREKAAFQQQQAAERAAKAGGAHTCIPQSSGLPPARPQLGRPSKSGTKQPATRSRTRRWRFPAVGSRCRRDKKAPRVQIDTPRVRGSISLAGARLDDLTLKDYRVSLDEDSPQIDLLQPIHGEKPYYVEFGWLNQDLKMPNRETIWKANGSTLSPENPITLSWDNGEGLVFEQIYRINDNFRSPSRSASATRHRRMSASLPMAWFPGQAFRTFSALYFA